MSSTWEIKQWSLQDRLRLGHPPQSSEKLDEKGYRRVICNDPQANLQFKYQGNSVSTTKFNIFTFLPKGLFEQFRRLANLYFLFIAILSLAPTSPIQPITNIFPLVLVLCMSLSKEAFEDWRRFRNDKRINSSMVEVLHGDSWAKITWSKLVVGNLVRIKSNEYFPADLVLLSTSNDEGLCFIETSNLDGESNLKTRRAFEQTWKYGNSNEASKFTGEIHCEHPNDSLYSFTGNLIIGTETYPISFENVLLRGCSLKNTSWTVGIVIFAGHETKIMKNALNVPSKRSRLEKKIDKVIYCLFGMLFTIALVGAIVLLTIVIDMEPAQQSEGGNVNKDPKSPLWQYVEILGKNPGGGSYKWRCSECKSIRNGSYTRVKAHLTGQTNTGVQVCAGPSDTNGKPGQGLSPAKIKFFASLQDAADRRLAKGKLPVQSPITRSPLPSRSTATANKRPTLGPLEAAFNNQGREVADEYVARCIYANGLAFNLVRSPYWQQMIKAVNEAPKGYKSPGYEKVRTTLLTSERQSVDKQLQAIRDTWVSTGVSIVSDGWRDQRNRPLINVIAICPQGAMFLKAVDCSGIEKDASFISSILIDAIESVGPQNVVQVITDNAQVCRAAGLIVEGRYDHIFWTPCAVHSLNLMLAKIGEIEWINEIYIASKEIQMFITNHSMSQAIYRGFAKLELLKCSGFFLDSNLWYLQLKDSGYIFSTGSTILVDLLMTISLITLYNTVIPISLYVSIEIIKFIQSTQFINKDINMYDEETNMYAQARTSNLNDELGQVEYIFSDKTGTLTQNVMEFHKCSIGGVIYGSGISEPQRVGTSTTKLPFEQIHVNRSKSGFYEKGFNFYDQRLMGGAWRNEQNPEICKEFFRCLAICHSALPEGETTPEKIKYLASSPDEVALVVAAKNLGFFFHRRTLSSIFVRESHVEGLGSMQDVEYKILNVLEFSSSRKRQSVICVHPSGQLVLYSKGADVAIYQRLENNRSTTALDTWSYLEKFASAGLRTLCVAYRFLDVDMYNSWNEKFMEAKSALTEREEKLNQVAELIEQQLILLGSVAIEDKLQDGVAMCIRSLLEAGIKIWVLTGDKLETAINVGYAACLVSAETRQIIISSDTKGDFAEVELKNWVKQQLIASLEDRNTNDNNTTLVIDGKCLTYALESDICETFLKLSCQCFTVICCRVTPLQKAQVTILIRHHARRVTLSIGDGANDVSMIQAAHVGVAIRGQEGMQAVMASDFAISQFRFLTELLLVHGRLSYIRISKVVTYFFYKNIALTMTQVWFTFFSGYSAANFYDDWYQSFYNILFTSLPAFAIGILDQDVSTTVSKQFPQLYKAGIDNLYFRWKLLARWMLSSVFQSFIIFYFSILTGFGGKAHGKILGQWDVGTLSFSCVVTTVNLQLLIGNSFLTHWHFISIFGSIVIWFLFLLFYTSIYSFWDAKENIYGQLIVPLSTLDFWLILLLASIAPLAVDLAFEGFRRSFMPHDYQIIQDMEYYRSNDAVSERNERRPSADLRAQLLQPS